MIRVGFVGVPGAGKTSTARGVASACRSIEGLKNIELSSEYARRYIAKYGPAAEPWEQYRILKKQQDWEDSVGYADIIISDSPIFSSLVYAEMLSKRTPKDIMVVNDLFSEMNRLNNPEPRYDIIFHLRPITEPVRDGVRAEVQFNPEWRAEADARIYSTYASLFLPKLLHTVETVSMEERVAECILIIKTYLEDPTTNWWIKAVVGGAEAEMARPAPLERRETVVQEAMGKIETKYKGAWQKLSDC